MKATHIPYLLILASASLPGIARQTPQPQQVQSQPAPIQAPASACAETDPDAQIVCLNTEHAYLLKLQQIKKMQQDNDALANAPAKPDVPAKPEPPQDKLDRCFGGFTLDPCATPQNAKCANFFTRAEDGLSKPWPGKVFMVPPYGREIGKWVKKAWEESLTGTLVVCLLPARVDTRWWHDYARKGHVYFLQGRLKFGAARNSAPFPSVLVTFGKFFSR